MKKKPSLEARKIEPKYRKRVICAYIKLDKSMTATPITNFSNGISAIIYAGGSLAESGSVASAMIRKINATNNIVRHGHRGQ